MSCSAYLQSLQAKLPTCRHKHQFTNSSLILFPHLPDQILPCPAILKQARLRQSWKYNIHCHPGQTNSTDFAKSSHYTDTVCLRLQTHKNKNMCHGEIREPPQGAHAHQPCLICHFYYLTNLNPNLQTDTCGGYLCTDSTGTQKATRIWRPWGNQGNAPKTLSSPTFSATLSKIKPVCLLLRSATSACNWDAWVL